AEAAVAAVKELTTGGIKAGAVAGGKLWAWIRGQSTGREADTLATVEAVPEKPSAPDKIKGVLKDLLAGNPGLQAEPGGLLREIQGKSYVSQTATATGGSTIAQAAGDKNRINIRR